MTNPYNKAYNKIFRRGPIAVNYTELTEMLLIALDFNI